MPDLMQYWGSNPGLGTLASTVSPEPYLEPPRVHFCVKQLFILGLGSRLGKVTVN